MKSININTIQENYGKRECITKIENVNGNIINNTAKISNAFNDFFDNVGQNMAAQIPKCTIRPESFISQLWNNNFFLYPSTPEDVYKAIAKLRSKGSIGIEGISSDFVKK